MSPRCHHCEEDTAQHTLEACTAWEVQRRALVLVIGEDLSLAAVVRAMTQEEESWRAVTTYCKAVIMATEEAERERRDRRRMPPPPPQAPNIRMRVLRGRGRLPGLPAPSRDHL